MVLETQVKGEPVASDGRGAEGTGRRLSRVVSAGAGATDRVVARLGLSKPVVILNGFWRSGTTWLQECLAESLGAKTVFEPLAPGNPLRNYMFDAQKNWGYKQALLPRDVAPNDPLWAYLDRTFHAGYGSQFSRLCRRSLFESLRPRIVVKDVRFHFMLDEIHDRYELPIIHIRRHPGATIASFTSQGWDWGFEDVKLVELLPHMADELAEFDADLVSRTSAYWAILERHVDRTMGGKPWFTMISYEEALANPAPAIADLCRFIGAKQVTMPKFDAPSASRFKPVPIPNADVRRRGWRDKLPAADIDRMRAVIGKLYPEYRFD